MMSKKRDGEERRERGGEGGELSKKRGKRNT